MDLMDAFHIFHEYISEKISLQSGAGHFIILDMDRFLNEVLKNIRKYELIHRGQQVVVGFSGGADFMRFMSSGPFWAYRSSGQCMSITASEEMRP